MTRCFSAWDNAFERIPSRRLGMSLGRAVLLGALLPSPAPAASPDLPAMLEQIGKRVEQFARHFSAVVCRETVTQEKLDARGKVIAKNSFEDSYTIVVQAAEGDLKVEESREMQRNAPQKAATQPLMMTNGFSTLVLVFHPRFQSRYEFSSGADENLEGRLVHRMDFEQVDGTPALSVLKLRGADYPVRWKGSAWVDPQSWAIVRLQASLKDPIEEIGLKALDSDVLYGSTQYPGSGETYWLPRSALIQAKTQRQHWRNLHRFQDYRRFTVDTKITVQAPE